jgi:hypothetical protein
MSAATAPIHSLPDSTIYEKLNSVWHRRALNLFMFVVLAHWAEHLAQGPRVRKNYSGYFFVWLLTKSLKIQLAIVMSCDSYAW